MDEAIALARAHGAEIHVLHVIDTRRYDTPIESATEPLRERGEGYVAPFVDAAEAASVPVTTAIETGRPARQLLEYADEHDVGLIVWEPGAVANSNGACSAASRATSSHTPAYPSTSSPRRTVTER